MPWRTFAAWNAAGSCAWAISVGGLAFTVGASGARWIAVGGIVLLVAGLAHLVWASRRGQGALEGRAGGD
jgi:membrane protein DedA with SNARE-associated domain